MREDRGHNSRWLSRSGENPGAAGLAAEIIAVAFIAIGFAIVAGACCEFLLKPLWHALAGGGS